MKLKAVLFGSLRRQLIFSIALVHAVMMGAFIIDLAYKQRDFLEQRQIEEARTLVRALSLAAASAMLSRDMAGLQELAQVDAADTNISYVMLVDPQGRVLAHSQPERVGLYLADAAKLREIQADEERVMTLSRDLVDMASSIVIAGKNVGWARVGIGQGMNQSRLQAVAINGLMYMLAAIVAGTLLALFLARRLTQRLNAIRDVAEAARNGDTQARAPGGGFDEAAVVGHSFNAMLDALAQEKRELQSVQARLEASEARLELALRASNDGLCDWDLRTNRVYYAPRWKAMLGYAEEDIGDSLDEWESRVHPDDLPWVYREIHRHLDGHTPQYESINRLRHKDGRWLWFLDRGLCLRDEEGVAYRMVSMYTDITMRVSLESELQRFKDAMDEHAIISMTDADGVITYVNDKFVAISGRSRADLIGVKHHILGSGLHPPEFFAGIWRTISTGHTWHGEICNRNKRGELYWLLATIVPFFGEEDKPERYIGLYTDITARKHAEDALHDEKELAQTTLASIGDGVVTTDAHARITFMNPVAERLTGWTLEEVRSFYVSEVMKLVSEETGEPVENPVERCRTEDRVMVMSRHTILIDRDGAEKAIEHSAAPIRSKDGSLSGVVMVFHDVSDTRAMTRKMAWQATHDTLTGLFNRLEFERRLQTMLSGAQSQQSHAMLYIDLDQFKVVNDTCGHQAGDELLRQLTALLHGGMRDSDTLARLGGDEFGVLLQHCPLEKAKEIGKKLCRLVREFRFSWNGRFFEVGASIGITSVIPGSHSMAEVMSAADMACYAAKEAGRNRVHVHDPRDADMQHRHDMMHAASGIRGALEQGRFRLYVQEIRALQGGSSHHEVLLRMRDEHGNLISPGTFIPAAERFGLMGDVDRWVVSTTFAALAEAGDIRLAINLSGLSLQDDGFIAFVGAILSETGIDAQRVCFEITETSAISNLQRAQTFVREMKQLGFRFALDDFGSGMSSFAYLKALPVDYLKIDGAFVRDMETDPIDRTFVKAIHHIGQAMGKETIAEYVESVAIADSLRNIGVHYAQGYGIAMPVPIETLLNASENR